MATCFPPPYGCRSRHDVADGARRRFSTSAWVHTSLARPCREITPRDRRVQTPQQPTWTLKPGSAATRLPQCAGVIGQWALGLDDPVLAGALPLVRLSTSEGVLAVVGRVPQRAASRADHRGFSMLRVLRSQGFRPSPAARALVTGRRMCAVQLTRRRHLGRLACQHDDTSDRSCGSHPAAHGSTTAGRLADAGRGV